MMFKRNGIPLFSLVLMMMMLFLLPLRAEGFSDMLYDDPLLAMGGERGERMMREKMGQPMRRPGGAGFKVQPMGKPGGNQSMGQPMQKPGEGGVMGQLGLNPNQRERLQSIFKNNRQQSQSAMQDLQSKRQQLLSMIQSGSGSKSQALSLHRQISQQQAALMEQRINMMYDVKAVMTPEQFQKFRALMEQKRQGGFGKEGRRPPGGGQTR